MSCMVLRKLEVTSAVALIKASSSLLSRDQARVTSRGTQTYPVTLVDDGLRRAGAEPSNCVRALTWSRAFSLLLADSDVLRSEARSLSIVNRQEVGRRE